MKKHILLLVILVGYLAAILSIVQIITDKPNKSNFRMDHSNERILLGGTNPSTTISNVYDLSWDYPIAYCPYAYPNNYDISEKITTATTFSFTMKIQNSWSNSNSDTPILFALTNQLSGDRNISIWVS